MGYNPNTKTLGMIWKINTMRKVKDTLALACVIHKHQQGLNYLSYEDVKF